MIVSPIAMLAYLGWNTQASTLHFIMLHKITHLLVADGYFINTDDLLKIHLHVDMHSDYNCLPQLCLFLTLFGTAIYLQLIILKQQ